MVKLKKGKYTPLVIIIFVFHISYVVFKETGLGVSLRLTEISVGNKPMDK
jgi:hypothetical protein